MVRDMIVISPAGTPVYMQYAKILNNRKSPKKFNSDEV